MEVSGTNLRGSEEHCLLCATVSQRNIVFFVLQLVKGTLSSLCYSYIHAKSTDLRVGYRLPILDVFLNFILNTVSDWLNDKELTNGSFGHRYKFKREKITEKA
jgi:hypothetical protein